MEDWQGGNQALKQEFDYPITDIDGEIPTDLRGTLFRNIPAMLDVNGQEVHHPFDADGMICKVTFADGQAHFQNRYVRTPGYCDEQEQGRITYRGVFGTEKSGGWAANAFDLRLKNVANTNVYYWGGKLMALWEASHPYRLNPRTLETEGPELLDGALDEGAPFAAHPMIERGPDGQPHRYVTFGINAFGVVTKLDIYELNPAAKVVQHQTHFLPGFAFMHDFTITPNYCIFFQNPMSFNPVPFLVGLRGPAECMTFRKEDQTRIWVISRHDANQVQEFKVKSGFVFHHANAFEDGDELVIDSVAYRDFPAINHQLSFKEVDFDAVPTSQLWRYQLNLNSKQVQRHQLETRCCDFPYVNPACIGHRHHWIYLAATHHPQANGPNQAILKINPDTQEQDLWSAAPRGFVGEPVFVARPNSMAEDDGWLFVVMYDAECDRSNIVILNAQAISEGPLATLHLRHHLPYGLHGSFTPEVWL
jgi:all-trans-8'-apo-beta-carotenal 15,15'-oxygenase